MNVISLFSGAGGMDLGFKQAGFNIVWANEYDSTIWKTYQTNHPETKLDTRSIRLIEPSELPDAEGIIGGPPCQSWSLAGSMRGIEDARGQLFEDYLRILKAKQPKFFVAENVPGMLSPKHKQAFESICQQFQVAGYRVSYQTVNAMDHGVPQDRKRVFIVGYRQDLGKTFNFHQLLTIEPKLTLKEAIGDLPKPKPALDKNKTNGNLKPANHEYFVGDFSSMYLSRNRRRNWKEQSFTIQAGARHAPLWPGSCPMEKVGKDKWQLTGEDYRRLSIRECARIQTFPDTFIFHYQSLVDGYKMIGNAVPVQLAQVIATQIQSDLNSK